MNTKRPAETMLEDLKSDILECQLCFKRYDTTEHKPLNLTCGHTYCKTCISGMLPLKENEVIFCPTCERPQFFLTIDELSVNYSLQSLHQVKKQQPM